MTWVLDLPELVAHLAAGRADVVGASPPAIFKSLEKQALLAFVTDVATSHLMGLTVSPSRTALPTATLGATVVNLDTVKDLTYTVSALADEAAVVEFRASADVLIAVRLPVGHQTADEWPVLTEVEDSRTVAVAKTLMLTGIVEVDSFRRPVSGEVSSVRARDDDPGLAAWVTRSAARASASLSETLEAARRSLEPSEAIRKVMAGLDTSGLDAIRKMSEPSEATRR